MMIDRVEPIYSEESLPHCLFVHRTLHMHIRDGEQSRVYIRREAAK
jgi:hypothetical protein